MPKSNLPFVKVSEDSILEKIYEIRGLKVMLDRDLAEMYGVEVKRLNQAVKEMPAGFRKISCFNYRRMNFKT